MQFMNEPDDRGSREDPPLSEEAARAILSWARTIDRWSSDGDRCFLVSEEGLRSATSDDVSDAMDRLSQQNPSPSD
jgi:hypothetical protein